MNIRYRVELSQSECDQLTGITVTTNYGDSKPNSITVTVYLNYGDSIPNSHGQFRRQLQYRGATLSGDPRIKYTVTVIGK